MGLTGADTGLEGRGWGPLEKSPLDGLPELKGLSTFREECFSELSRSPSRSGMAKELRSGMCTRSDRLFCWAFFLPPLPPGQQTSFFFLVSMAALPITLSTSLIAASRPWDPARCRRPRSRALLIAALALRDASWGLPCGRRVGQVTRGRRAARSANVLLLRNRPMPDQSGSPSWAELSQGHQPWRSPAE